MSAIESRVSQKTTRKHLTTNHYSKRLFSRFVSESIRWLLSKGEQEKAEKILRKAAKVNKVTLPDVLLDEEEMAKDKVRYWYITG